jgi:AbrB family looped-hinge helix DNA binding protein
MKIVKISTTNQKGQIVIPKEIRERLNINSSTQLKIQTQGQGLYIEPIEELITAQDQEPSYPDLLKETQGKWAG